MPFVPQSIARYGSSGAPEAVMSRSVFRAGWHVLLFIVLLSLVVLVPIYFDLGPFEAPPLVAPGLE
jgi:hypothetical protein